MTPKLNSLTPFHHPAYGRPARAPDPTRCAERVFTGYTSYQCRRKRGYGPEGAYCKQHDPAEKEKRRAAKRAKYKARREADKPKHYAHEFLAALRRIADGHNDPRGLAQSVLDKFEGKDA